MWWFSDSDNTVQVFECGLQKRYLSLICHYKGRFLQAIFHTSMSISIHDDDDIDDDDDGGGVAAPQARILCLKTFYYQTAPMFLMTLHSFLPSYISHLMHFSIHTKSLHWRCAADLLRRRPHVALWNHGITQTWYYLVLPKLGLFTWRHCRFSL